MKKLLGALALVLAVAAGWWLYAQRDAGISGVPGLQSLTATDSRAEALLEYVPADSAYVLAPLQALPEALSDTLIGQAEASLAVWPEVLQNLRQELADKDDAESAELLQLLDLLEAEFHGKSLTESITHLGLSRSGLAAIYAIDLVPVVLIHLDDAARFGAFLDRLQAGSPVRLQRGELEGQTTWTLPADVLGEAPLQPLLAVVDGYLVATVVPVADGLALSRQMLGLDKPARSLADSGELARRAAELGFLPFAVGYLDSAKLLAQSSQPKGDAAIGFLAALKIEPPELDAVCQAEITAMAAQAPGMSLGFTQLDADGQSMRGILHLSSEISSELMKLRAPMPGGPELGADALLSFGLAMSVKQLPGVASRLAGRVSSAPYACGQLLPLNKVAADIAKGLNDPMLSGFSAMAFGLQIVIDDFGLGAKGDAPTGSGMFLLGSDNPQSLVGLAKGFVPQLAQLDVPEDGSAVALPAMPDTPPGVPELFVARSDKVLAISAGQPSAALLSQRLSLDPTWQPTLSSRVSGRFYEVLGAALDSAAAELPDSSEKRQLITQARMLREVHAKLFEQASFSLDLTERGIEFQQSTQVE